MTADAIVIEGLRVERGGELVLPGLDFGVPTGSVTGLLGPSGSGKTTLLRAIVGVQRVAGGRVEVLGVPAGDARLRRRLAYMTQSPSVYCDLSVTENLRYFGALLDVPRSRIAATLDEVELAGQRDRLVNRLSGGQRARVSLAVALLAEPEVLVLDEPTVGLDPVLRRDLWTLFHRLADAGAALLVSSHVMDEAARCDRLLLLREGMLLADDRPTALLERTGAADLEEAFLRLIPEPSRAEVVL
jgi:ABC-2 type transport system ATP-binding protein